MIIEFDKIEEKANENSMVEKAILTLEYLMMVLIRY